MPELTRQPHSFPLPRPLKARTLETPTDFSVPQASGGHSARDTHQFFHTPGLSRPERARHPGLWRPGLWRPERSKNPPNPEPGPEKLETPTNFCTWPFLEGQTARDTLSTPKSGARKTWDTHQFLHMALFGRPNGSRHPLNPKIRGPKSVRHPPSFAYGPLERPNGSRHPLTLFGPYINRVT